MFIPRGTILHENLATSYVLVDSLVADLCEGGFSGVVEVRLRRSDAHLILARGRVAAILQAQHGDGPDSGTDYTRATVAEVAAAARHERGRVSIYHYSAETAEAIGGRVTAEALYTQLSTEFADIEKVITKLSRERDRQWFIEISMASGLAVLVHITNEGCRMLTARDGVLRETHESANAAENAALAVMIAESRLMGSVFDVYFRSAGAVAADEWPPEVSSKEDHKIPADPEDVADVVKEARAVFHSLSLDETTATPPERPAQARAMSFSPEAASALRELSGSLGQPLDNGDAANGDAANGDAANEGQQAVAIESAPLPAPAPLPSDEVSPSTWVPAATDLAQDTTADEVRAVTASGEALQVATDNSTLQAMSDERQPLAASLNPRRSTKDLLLMPDDLRATGMLKRGSQADVLAEIKRLMSEIVRAVEESIRATGTRDSFTMHLRAGQLKVAERYPFLDPFGSEFEYLAGEIVFVGDVNKDDFIFGLSEALEQAIDSAARASAQPARVRSHAAEGLRWLLDRQRIEFELYHLDQALEAIIAEIDDDQTKRPE